jgi:hypothetical protein
VLFFIFDASGVHAELTHFLSLSPLWRQSSDESKRLTSEVDEWGTLLRAEKNKAEWGVSE